jgi:hypothetical protein
MERGVDCSRILRAVDPGNLPCALAHAAEAPSAGTAISFGEQSGVSRAGAAAFDEAGYSVSTVEHSFADDTWQTIQSYRGRVSARLSPDLT